MVAVVENTKYLLSHREHDEEIAKDVEFNYNLLMQKNDEQKTMWRHWHDDLGVDWWQLEKLIVNRIGYDDVIMNLPEEYLPDHLYDDSDRGTGHRADNKGNNE